MDVDGSELKSYERADKDRNNRSIMMSVLQATSDASRSNLSDSRVVDKTDDPPANPNNKSRREVVASLFFKPFPQLITSLSKDASKTPLALLSN